MGSSACRPVTDDPEQLVQSLVKAELVVPVDVSSLRVEAFAGHQFESPLQQPGAGCSLAHPLKPLSNIDSKSVELSNLAMNFLVQASEAELTSESEALPHAADKRSAALCSPGSPHNWQEKCTSTSGLSGCSDLLVPKIMVAEGEFEVHVGRTLEKGPVIPFMDPSYFPKRGMMSRGLGLGGRIKSLGAVAALPQGGGTSGHSDPPAPAASPSAWPGDRHAPQLKQELRPQQPGGLQPDIDSGDDGDLSMDSCIDSEPERSMPKGPCPPSQNEASSIFPRSSRVDDGALQVTPQKHPDMLQQDQHVDSERSSPTRGPGDSRRKFSPNLLDLARRRLVDTI